jgi:hypothetical protein
MFFKHSQSKKKLPLNLLLGDFSRKRKTRADARSVLVSKKLSLGGGGGWQFFSAIK